MPTGVKWRHVPQPGRRLQGVASARERRHFTPVWRCEDGADYWRGGDRGSDGAMSAIAYEGSSTRAMRAIATNTIAMSIATPSAATSRRDDASLLKSSEMEMIGNSSATAHSSAIRIRVVQRGAMTSTPDATSSQIALSAVSITR